MYSRLELARGQLRQQPLQPGAVVADPDRFGRDASSPSVPVQVDYAITGLGRSLLTVVHGIKEWAEEHMDEVGRRRAAFDEAHATG